MVCIGSSRSFIGLERETRDEICAAARNSGTHAATRAKWRCTFQSRKSCYESLNDADRSDLIHSNLAVAASDLSLRTPGERFMARCIGKCQGRNLILDLWKTLIKR